MGFEPITLAYEASKMPFSPFRDKSGRSSRIWTYDHMVPNHVLYQTELYSVKLVRVVRLELTTITWKDIILPLNYTR